MNTAEELISIIVPVYNVSDCLLKCLDSISGQQYRNLEVILVDDGSSDGSGEICDRYAESDSRFQVIHQENSGVLAARNRGIARASGVYLSFVDGDDWIAPEMYRCLYDEAKLQEADLVHCTHYIVHEATGSCYVERGRMSGAQCEVCHKMGKTAGVVSEEVSWSLYGKLFKRELIFQNYQKVDSRLTYFEDAVLVIFCVIQSQKCVLLDKPMYYYRQRDHSLYHRKVPNWLEQVNIFYDNIQNEAAAYSEKWFEKVKYCVADATFLGLNTMMGLNLKYTLPFYVPPFSELEKVGRLVLYGAGKIGQSYYRLFQLVKPGQVVLWVDKQAEKRRQEGLPVTGLSGLLETDFDQLLIAVWGESSAQQIQKELEGYGIAPERILWRPPRTLLSDGT